MCLLQETFIWIERIKDGDRKALPTSVKEELLSCALLLPFATLMCAGMFLAESEPVMRRPPTEAELPRL